MLNPVSKMRSEYLVGGYMTVIGLLCAHLSAFLVVRFA